MARRKSIRDIWSQYERIRSEGNTSRTERAFRTAQRYGRRIQSSSAWRSAFNSARNNYDLYHTSERHLRDYNANRQTYGYGQADRTRVSRSTYMGLNAG